MIIYKKRWCTERNVLIVYPDVLKKGSAFMDKNNCNQIIAENLKDIRIGKGWSQSFVAGQLGIAQRTISRAECGVRVSQRTLKLLCGFYQVPIAALYNEAMQEPKKSVQVVPDDVAIALLTRNSFIHDLEREVVLRYTANIQKESLMMREDIERILPEVLSVKKSYSLMDVISACMLVNQKTVSRVRDMVTA